MITFNAKTKKTTFSVSVPEAHNVRLLGDFNGWNPESHPMKKGRDGVWKIDIVLPPGTYQFRYYIDQSWWMNDPTAGLIPNDKGSENSVITVEPYIIKTRKAPARKAQLRTAVTKKNTKK